MKKIINIMGIFYMLVLTSCTSIGSVYGNTKIETRTFGLKDFDSVTVGLFSSSANIIQGDEFKIEISLDANLFDFINVYVAEDGKSLIIKQVPNINIRKAHCSISVTMPKLRSLYISGVTKSKVSGFNNMDMPLSLHVGGSGSITADVSVENVTGDVSGSGDIWLKGKTEQYIFMVSGSGNIMAEVNANNINTTISGSGDIQLKGKTEKLISVISGSGSLNAAALNVDNMFCKVLGSGNITVHVENSLEATVSGSGSVQYAGNPPKVNLHSSGSGRIQQLE